MQEFEFYELRKNSTIPKEDENKYTIKSVIPHRDNASKYFTSELHGSETGSFIFISPTGEQNNDSLFWSCEEHIRTKNHSTLAELLNSAPASLVYRQDDVLGRTLLHYACVYKNVFAVNALLRMGADPFASDSRRQTALHHAARSGDLEIATLLPNDADQYFDVSRMF
jgi:ankyrin repeat protein